MATSNFNNPSDSVRMKDDVTKWLWARLKEEEDKFAQMQAIHDQEIQQVEQYVDEIRLLADERDRLVAQLQEDNRILKTELIAARTPSEKLAKWINEKCKLNDSIMTLPMCEQVDIILDELAHKRYDLKNIKVLYQSEKKDADLCRKRLEEVSSYNVSLKDKFHKYKVDKEMEVEKLKQTVATQSEKTDSEMSQMRKSNKELQKELLANQKTLNKQVVDLQKLIRGLDDENDQLKSEVQKYKTQFERAATSLAVRDDELKELKEELTNSRFSLKESVDSHSKDVSLLHKTMEDILSARDSEAKEMVASLEKENEGLKQTIEQFKKDTKRNKSQVNELELRLSEAKEVCRQKTEEADHVQNILKTKITNIRDQLHQKDLKEKQSSDSLKDENKKLQEKIDALKKEIKSINQSEESERESSRDQLRSLQGQLDLKERMVISLKAANKSLLDEISGFRQQHGELDESLSALKIGYKTDLSSHKEESQSRVKSLKEDLQTARDQIRQLNKKIEDQAADLSTIRKLLMREKEENSINSKTLKQKEKRIEELENEKRFDMEKFYDLKLKFEQQLRQDEESKLRNHNDIMLRNQHEPVSRNESYSPTMSLSAKDNFSPLHTPSAAKGINVRKGGNGVSIKDKNELIDMNKESLLEHCLALQFEVSQLLAENDSLTEKHDEEFRKNLERKSRYKEKLETLKDKLNKEKMSNMERVAALEHQMTSLKMELSHQNSLRSSWEQTHKRLSEDKRELTSRLEVLTSENKKFSRNLTSAERKLREWKHENDSLQEKLDVVTEEKNQMEKYLTENTRSMSHFSPNNTLSKSLGLGTSISFAAN